MKKVLVLILGLSLLAASCDTVDSIFGTTPGARGVFKSEDAGATYRTASNLANGNITGTSVNALVFDPSNQSIIYLGAGEGIYKSVDGAAHWKYILSGIGTAAISVDPYQTSTVYAAGISGNNGKIIKSLDGGTSWVEIYTEPSKGNAVLAFDVSKGLSAQVLAGLGSGEIIRSTDGGHTWQATKDFSDKILEIKFAPNGTAYALTLRKGVFKSTDAGITWSQSTAALTQSGLTNSGFNTASVTQFNALTLDHKQAGVLYLGTDQGLFRTVNDGSNWSFMSLPVKNASLSVSGVAVNPSNSNNLFVGVGNTMFESLNGGVTWETKILATGAQIKIILMDPKTNNNIYLGIGNPR
jgi:photosystem II stability/assembly factor-like uncharacterized protein